MSHHSSPRLPLILLAITLLIVFHRLLSGEVFFWGLPALQFYPWREYAFDMLRAGQIPFWNFFNGAGAPLLANYQSALLYPPNWVGFVLPLAWSMSLTAVLHLFIAGWGMWMFTGRLGLLPLGRGISALAFGLTGYLVARLGTYPTISAAAWIPWVLWATLGLLQRGQRRDLAWLALFAALQLLAGHAQTTWYGMLLAVTFSLWWAVTHRPVDKLRLLSVLGGLALGAGIAALQLLPTAELLLHSQRSGGVDPTLAMNFSYSWARTLNLLSPNIFGNPGDGSYITENGAFFEDAVYIGLLPLISALAAVFTWAWGKLRRREHPSAFATVSFWLIIVLVTFVLALGKNAPVFPFLYDHIPTFDLFQAPVRWHIWTVFGLSVLAGIGVSVWGHGHWLFFGTRLATAAGVGAVLLAIFAPRILPADVTASAGVQVMIRAVVLTGILGALAGVLTLAQPENRSGRQYSLWMVAVLGIVAFDLGYAAWGLNPTIPADFYARRSPPETNFARAFWPQAIQDRVMYDDFLRFDDFRVAVEKRETFRTSGLPNLNLIDRLPLLNNFEPLLVGHFDNYLDWIKTNPDRSDTLLAAAGVDAAYDDQGNLRPINSLHKNAWFVASICWHPDESSLQAALLDPGWQPFQQAHLIGLGNCPSVPSERTVQADVVDVLMQPPNRLTIQVSTATGGLLVVPNTDYPGWQAAIDGLPARILRVNGAFQAIEVPAGTQTVQLEYRPGWLWPAILISAVSLLALLVLFRSKNPDLNTESGSKM